MNYRSDNIDLITGAMAKAQGSYKVLVPNEKAAGGMFANLQAVIESVKGSLSENGLAFYQYVELLDEGAGASLLKTIISHESGQWISTVARIVTGTTFRETFNCIEAYRRLHALLLLGIAPSPGDPLIKDDNGLEQQDKVILQSLRKPNEAPPKSEHTDTITSDQYDDIMFELEGYDVITKGIQEFYKISSLADLPKTEFYNVQARIRKLKKTHEEYVRK